MPCPTRILLPLEIQTLGGGAPEGRRWIRLAQDDGARDLRHGSRCGHEGTRPHEGVRHQQQARPEQGHGGCCTPQRTAHTLSVPPTMGIQALDGRMPSLLITSRSDNRFRSGTSHRTLHPLLHPQGRQAREVREAPEPGIAQSRQEPKDDHGQRHRGDLR